MKKLIAISAMLVISLCSFAQTQDRIESVIEDLAHAGFSEDEIEDIIKDFINDPELYNEIWGKLIDRALKQDSTWGFLNDLNIEFKTFQTEDIPTTSLGFSYDVNFDYSNYVVKDNAKIAKSFGLSAKGNVAFDKRFNPNDFLDTQIDFTYSRFKGGVVAASSQENFNRLNEIDDELVQLSDPQSEEAQELWREHAELLVLSNQSYFSISPKVSLESNQDFSKVQFVPGLLLDLGVKAWNNDSKLAKFNILDYPFALIRRITGIDNEFTVYGSTLPGLQVGLDYVVPTEDTVRNEIVGNLNPFTRFRIETGFRTVVSQIKNESIFFSVSLRFYQELNAPQEIKNANLNDHFYFVMALQSSTGFYVSFADGKLPFDARGDQVYSIGFNYKF